MATNRTVRSALPFLIALFVPIVPFVLVGELPGDRWLSAAGFDAFWVGLTGCALLGSDTFLPVPSSVVGTLMGARLGFVPGWVWSWVGLVAGNAAGYAIGRLLPSRLAPPLPRGPTLVALFVSRPVPVLAEAAVIAAGADRTPLGAFLLVTGAGSGVYAAALAASGASFLPRGSLGLGLTIPLLLPAVGWALWRGVSRVRRAAGRSSPTKSAPRSAKTSTAGAGT